MFGTTTLEVIMGLAFIYFLLSLVCSALNEMIAQFFKLRARTLQEGVRNLLADDRLHQQFYEHPLIKALYRGERKKVEPSYIPARTFALALLDIIAPAEPGGPKEFEQVRAAIAGLAGQSEIRRALLTLVDAAEGRLDLARKNIETWFDDAMDRVSGWYKQKVQVILIGLAIGVSIGLNADTLAIAHNLWLNPTLRQGVITAAQSYINENDALEQREQTLDQLQRRLRNLDLPLGWSEETIPGHFWTWLQKIMGLAITIAAVSLGAPFWFDLLNRVAKLRATGQVPEKTSETPPLSRAIPVIVEEK